MSVNEYEENDVMEPAMSDIPDPLAESAPAPLADIFITPPSGGEMVGGDSTVGGNHSGGHETEAP